MIKQDYLFHFNVINHIIMIKLSSFLVLNNNRENLLESFCASNIWYARHSYTSGLSFETLSKTGLKGVEGERYESTV